MLWIGITGPMGSGKSTVGRTLRDLGYVVLDADAVVAEVLDPGGVAEREILISFGDVVAGPDGHLDRRALSRVVFADPAALLRLEAILHPRVRARVSERRAELVAEERAVAFYDVPLLFEKDMQSQFDRIWVVSTAHDLRLTRVMVRTGLTAAEVEARWANQLPPEYKEARASLVIRNDGDERALRAAVEAALVTLPIAGATD